MKLKNMALSGMIARKIMVVPCIVNSWLYVSGDRNVLFGVPSWIRSSSASMPPIRKKTKAVAPYRMPMRLWSTVVSQLHRPVGSAWPAAACARCWSSAVVAIRPCYW